MTKFTAKCRKCGEPARATRDPICGECFMDIVKKGDEGLHDRIATTNPSFAHRKPPGG